MTREVLLTISGLQITPENEGEPQPVEVITGAEYYNKNDKHYLLYDEVTEGMEGTTKNRIKLNRELLEVTKKGITNVHMIFEKNKKNITYYDTPFGSMMIGILAKDIDVAESEQRIRVNVTYALEINYEYMADCSIQMDIRSKNTRDFKLYD